MSDESSSQDEQLWLQGFLGAQASQVETALDAYLPAVEPSCGRLHEAMRYCCLGGGKRIRGIFVLLAADAAGAPRKPALAAAAAAEMLHAYSLIHDDLPCMDDDDLRRGKPSCHIAYGEALAVLAGDALLTRAAELLVELHFLGTSPRQALEAARTLLGSVGTAGMLGGQVLDLDAEGRRIDADALHDIHARKTGALFRGALLAGAALGSLTDAARHALAEYAAAFGLAFQITDDLLDVEGDEHTLGKRIGADVRQAKATFPSLYGIDGAHEMARREAGRARAALAALPEGDAHRSLHALVDYLLLRRK